MFDNQKSTYAVVSCWVGHLDSLSVIGARRGVGAARVPYLQWIERCIGIRSVRCTTPSATRTTARNDHTRRSASGKHRAQRRLACECTATSRNDHTRKSTCEKLPEDSRESVTDAWGKFATGTLQRCTCTSYRAAVPRRKTCRVQGVPRRCCSVSQHYHLAACCPSSAPAANSMPCRRKRRRFGFGLLSQVAAAFSPRLDLGSTSTRVANKNHNHNHNRPTQRRAWDAAQLLWCSTSFR